MKYTRSAIGLLTREYRSVLKKCLLINLGLFALGAVATATPANAKTYTGHTGEAGALSITDETVSITDEAIFKDNTSTSHGAGLYSKATKTGVPSGATFNGNVTFNNNEVVSTASSGSGAGAFVSGGNFSFLGTNNSFTDNHMNATIDSSRQYKVGGGAIANQSYWDESTHAPIDATMVIGKADGSSVNTFSGNSSSTNGGAIMNRAVDTDGNATLTINGTTTFSNNSANGIPTAASGKGKYNGLGGAIYNVARNDEAPGHIAQLNLNNGTYTFTGNTAYSDGGAVWNSGTLNISNAVFGDENDATKGNKSITAGGGAIYNEGTLNVDNAKFYNNTAKWFGAIRDKKEGTSVTITNSIFKNNSAEETGAVGIFSKNGTSSISGSTFEGNHATLAGTDVSVDGSGALFVGSEATLTVSNTTFKNNTSAQQAGAIGTRNYNDNDKAKLDIIGSTFTGNTANTVGGAINNFLSNSTTNSGFVTVKDSTFTSNSAANGGAVYNHKAGDTSFANASIVDGKIYISDSDFTGNTATEKGGALYNAGIATIAADAKNVTFSGNKANNKANDIYNKGTLNLNAASGKKIALNGGIDGDSVNKGTVNIAGDVEVSNALKNQTVAHNSGELHLNNTNLTGSTINVAADAIINTIDNIINDYSGSINLASGAIVKGDINFLEATADKYAATSGNTIKYAIGNLIGNAGKGSKTIKIASDGVNVDASEAKFTSDNGLSITGTANGEIVVTGFDGGIADAADASEDVASIQYQLTENEELNENKEIKDNFVLEGNGNAADKFAVDLKKELAVASGANMTVKDAVLKDTAGTGALTNKQGANLNIKDARIGVNLNNYGVMYSDPTYYDAKVVNEGTATFDHDIFESTSSLTNNATVNLIATEFKDGSTLTGGENNVLNLVSGTSKFNGTSSGNNVFVANGAKFEGTLTGGTVNTQNGAIDTITGAVSGSNLSVDANLVGSGAIDTFGTASTGVIKAINLTSTKYGTYATNDKKELNIGNLTLDANVEITGATNYYTKVEKDATTGNLVFSDKLVNTTGMQEAIGNIKEIKVGAVGNGAHVAVDNASKNKAELSADYTTTDATPALYTSGINANANDKQVEISAKYYANASSTTTPTKEALIRTSIDASGESPASKVEVSADTINMTGATNITGNTAIDGTLSAGATTVTSLKLGASGTPFSSLGNTLTVSEGVLGVDASALTGSIATGSTGFVTGGAVFSALGDKVNNSDLGFTIAAEADHEHNQYTSVKDYVDSNDADTTYTADGSTLTLSGTEFSVKDNGITYAKMNSGAVQHTATTEYAGDAYKKLTTKGYVDESLAAKSLTLGTDANLGLATIADGTTNATVYTKDKADTTFAAINHTHANATTTAAGFMSANDKAKLDGIATGAEVNVINAVTVGGAAATMSGKTVQLGSAAGATVLSGAIAEVTDATKANLVSADQVKGYVGNGTLTIKRNGTTVDSFAANATADKVIDITDSDTTYTAGNNAIAIDATNKTIGVKLASTNSGLSITTGDTGGLAVSGIEAANLGGVLTGTINGKLDGDAIAYNASAEEGNHFYTAKTINDTFATKTALNTTDGKFTTLAAEKGAEATAMVHGSQIANGTVAETALATATQTKINGAFQSIAFKNGDTTGTAISATSGAAVVDMATGDAAGQVKIGGVNVDVKGWASKFDVANIIPSTDTTTAADDDHVYSAAKADDKFAAKATSLAGYGITDAYTKTEVQTYVADNAADAIFTPASGGNPAVTIRAAINSKADATETATALGLKADTAKLQTTTAGATDGYDINAKTLKVAGVDAVTVSGNQTLTNKTIDAASNTISNLGVANLASTSVLKIADVTAEGFNPATLDDSKLATAGAIYTAVNGVINYKQNTWGSKELGYDTATTDAPTKLAALGFAAETETVGGEQVSRLGFLQAVKQNKASIDAYKTLNDTRFEDKTGVEGKFTVAESIQNRIQGATNGDADDEVIDATTKVYSVAGANEAIQAALSDDEQDIVADEVTAHSATLNATSTTADTPAKALDVTATNSANNKTSKFAVTSDGITVKGGLVTDSLNFGGNNTVNKITASMINSDNKGTNVLATAAAVYKALGKVDHLITGDDTDGYTFNGDDSTRASKNIVSGKYRGNLVAGTTVADDLIELDNVFGMMKDLSGTSLEAYDKDSTTGTGSVAKNLQKLNDHIHGTASFTDVVLGDAAATTTLGNTKAKIALSEAAETATITAANGLVLNGSQAITGIDNTTIPVSATDPTADGKEKVLATTATVAKAVKDVTDAATVTWNHAEGWLNTALGIDSTSHDADEALQVALNDLGAAAPTGDGKGNNIAANSFAGALHELDVEKAGLDLANVFTNDNTFNGDVVVAGDKSISSTATSGATYDLSAANGLVLTSGANTTTITAAGISTPAVTTPKLTLNGKDLTASSYEANLVTVTPYVAATGTAPDIAIAAGDNATVTTTKTLSDSLAGVVTYAGEVFKQKQDWMSQEFGYDTNTTDANTVLGASGAKYADQNGDGKVGFADALIQLNGDATVAGSVKNSIKTLAAGANYDNTTSGLTATTIQAAIDENAANIKANAIIDANSVSKAGYVATDTVKAAVVAIDAALHEDEHLLGDAQTSAATSGILTGKIIGGKDADATKNINVVDAIDLIAKKAVGLDTANVFTNLNTFKYDGGIALQDSAGGNSTRLKATAKGLEVDRTVVAEGFRLGDNTVTSIDVDGSAVGAAAANANKMATGSTVYYGAKDANYTGTRVAGATSTATLGNAISEATTLANTIETKITVAAGTYKAISAGDGVAANLIALDTAVGTIQTSDTKQNKQLDTLATEIGGSYAGDGTFTHTAFTSTKNIGATDPITTAISSIDAAIGDAGTLNSGIAGYTGTEVVGAVKQLSANLTNGTVNANFGSTTVDSLTIDGTSYGITSGGAATFASVTADSVTTDSLKIGDAAAITSTTTGLDMGNNDLSNIAKISFHGSTDYVNAIDTGAAAKTASSENNATTMATVATVLKSAENAEFNAANTESGALNGATTIKAAIDNVAAAVDSITDGMGDVAELATQAAVDGSNINNPVPGSSPIHATTVVSAIKDLDNAIGNIETGITHDYAKNGGTVPNSVARIIQTVAENVYTEIHGDGTATSEVNIGDEASLTTVGKITTVGTGTDAEDYLTGLQIDTTDNGVTLAAYDATSGRMIGMDVDADEGKIVIGDSADDAYGLEMDTVNGMTTIGDGSDQTRIGKGTLEIGKVVVDDPTDPTSGTHFEAGLHMDKDTIEVGDTTNGDGVKLDATDGSITTTGDANIGGDLAVASDATIAGKTTSESFANTNETFTVDSAGQVKARNFSNNTGTFSVSKGGSLTASEYHNGNNSFVVNTKGDVTAHSLTFNRTDKVNAIDVDGSNVSSTVAAATRKATLATAETVYAGAENAKYTNNGTGVVKAKNVATLHDAIQVLDNAMGTMNLSSSTTTTFEKTAATGTEPATFIDNATEALLAIDTVVGNVKALDGTTKGNLDGANKSVAEHLAKLDNRLGSIKAIDGGANGNLAGDDSDVATHFNSLDVAMGNRTNYKNNSGSNGYVAQNDGSKDLTTMISEVASNIGTAGDITSTNQISANQTVNANLSALDTALGNVADLQELGYGNVTEAIIGTNEVFSKAINQLDMNYRDLRHDFEAGMAGQAALSALVPNGRARGDTQLSVGTGMYKGHTAAAVGGFHWLTDNLLFNAGVAWDNAEATGRLGVTYSW